MGRGQRQRVQSALAACVVGAGGAMVLPPAPAVADCIAVEVAARALDGAETYVVGPDRCVVATPFAECLVVAPHAGEPGTVQGRAELRLTCPD